MPTTYKKVLNQGTSNPIVARTTVQCGDIMSPFPMNEDSKTQIFQININLCQRLLTMEQFANWLDSECETIMTTFLDRGLEKIGDDAFETPYVIDLESRAEAYLQAAKLCIRDCGLIFGALVGMNFDHKYHKIINWAEGRFGKDDNFSQWLASQQSWIKQILDMRNALEHPSDVPRGQLHIRNVEFKFSTDGVSGEVPLWFLTGEPPTSILIDTQNINAKILEFAEDILAATVLRLFPEIPITVRVIPEEQRDPKRAVRLELVPRGFLNAPNAT